MKNAAVTTPFQTGRISNVLLILLACLATYLNAVHVGFLALDDISMLNMFHSTNFSLRELFSLYDNRYFRPLGFATLLVDLRMFGPNPGLFHLVNITIHTCNALLVYYLALELLGDRTVKDRYALIAALCFALHPANSEAVVWIGARFDLLSGLFYLLSLILLVKRSSSVSPFVIICLGLSFLCALLSKESSFSLLILAPLYFIVERKRILWPNALALFTIMILSTMIYFYLRNGFSSGSDMGLGKVLSNNKSLLAISGDSVTAYGFYLGKMAYPLPLNFTISAINKPKSLVFLLVFIPAIAITFYRRRDTRLPILMLLTGLVLPLTALIGNLPWVPYAERYLYLPLIGFSLAIGLFISYFSAKIPYALVLAGVLLLAIPTVQRVNLWADPIAFWNDAVRKSPQFATPRLLLAAELINEGSNAEARRQLQGALEIGLNREIDRQFAMKMLDILNQGKGNS